MNYQNEDAIGGGMKWGVGGKVCFGDFFNVSAL